MNAKPKKYLKILSTAIAALVLSTLIGSTSALFAQSDAAQSGSGSGGTTTQQTDGAGQQTITANGADIVAPSDVENIKAVAGDGEVQLIWDAATDNIGVTGYKIYRGTHAVKISDDRYDLPTIPVGNVTTYVVKNLTNEKTFYFSLTAVDAAGNESPNYATEASATPQNGLHLAALEDDGKSPQVTEVKAEDVITVLVTFSEPVKLPEEHPASAFQIEKAEDKARLEVQKADVDARDSSGKTVLLTTAPQETGAEYVVTAGIELQDNFNNPVISGTSDTGSFKGSAKQKPATTTLVASNAPVETGTGTTTETSADTAPPTVTGGSADFNNRLTVTFSEPVELPPNPKTKFIVVKKESREALRVINVSLSNDGKTAYLTTDPQQAVDYEVAVSGVNDSAGNEILASGGVAIVTGKGSSIEDLVPPEDVTKLIARIIGAGKNVVELTWEGSKNSAGDLNDQLLYQSDDQHGAAYGDSASLGTSTISAEVQDLKQGNWYTFKVTTKDLAGNESRGAVASIFLPKTGPGVVAAGLTSLVMGLYRRRKKTKEPK